MGIQTHRRAVQLQPSLNYHWRIDMKLGLPHHSRLYLLQQHPPHLL